MQKSIPTLLGGSGRPSLSGKVDTLSRASCCEVFATWSGCRSVLFESVFKPCQRFAMVDQYRRRIAAMVMTLAREIHISSKR